MDEDFDKSGYIRVIQFSLHVYFLDNCLFCFGCAVIYALAHVSLPSDSTFHKQYFYQNISPQTCDLLILSLIDGRFFSNSYSFR